MILINTFAQMFIFNTTLVRIITRGFARAITIWPFILVLDQKDKEDVNLINHERIHLRQQMELLIVPFYLWYGIEYIIHRFRGKEHKLAYRAISFEREAYANEWNLRYLESRKFWSFWKYL